MFLHCKTAATQTTEAAQLARSNHSQNHSHPKSLSHLRTTGLISGTGVAIRRIVSTIRPSCCSRRSIRSVRILLVVLSVRPQYIPSSILTQLLKISGIRGVVTVALLLGSILLGVLVRLARFCCVGVSLGCRGDIVALSGRSN